jgi:hypothetical protein
MAPELIGEPLETLIRCYLSPENRDDLQDACINGTLTAEMARHPRRVTKGTELSDQILKGVSRQRES